MRTLLLLQTIPPRSTWWWSVFRSSFHFAKRNIQKPVELSRENGTTVVNWIKVSNWSNSFAFRPQFWLLFGKVGLETRIFWNHGTASFGPPDGTVKEDHLWRWTTLTGKFPLGPKRSIYFLQLTENSENFGTMESNRLFKVLSKERFQEKKKKGMEKLAKVFLLGVAKEDDKCYLKSVYYNSEYISLHNLKLSRNR